MAPNDRRGFVAGRGAVPALRGAVLAIGNFDGVHRGHRALIETARGMARAEDRPAAVLTFEPHPRQVFAPDRPFFRLTPEREKLAVLRAAGLDGVMIQDFDRTLAGTSARDFVAGLVAGTLGASGVVVGHDFHFGRGREGNPEVMIALCRELGLRCAVVPVVEEAGAAVSSTAIREALAEGDAARANEALGYRWFVAGEVRHGEKRGRVLGYPTANMRLPDGCGLRHGIYAVRMATGEAIVDGVASFGRRPTFDNGAPLLETHLFGFAGNLYGREVAVEIVGWIRGEERFESVQDLVAQMDRDSERAHALLAEEGGPPSLLASL